MQAGESGNVPSVTSNTVTIASVLVSSAVLIVLGACAIEFYRRRKMKAQRELSGRRMPAAVTPGNFFLFSFECRLPVLGFKATSQL